MSSTWIRWQCFNLAVYCSLEALFSAGLGLKLICEGLNIYTVIEYVNTGYVKPTAVTVIIFMVKKHPAV